MKRRLAAVLYADVAGYSSLTGRDEARTHLQLNRCLEILEKSIVESGGRKVHEAGDAILAEFFSVSAAVEAAVNTQTEIAGIDSNSTDQETVRFRIGLNLGEVIIDRDDIYGDGVNIAARIQELAKPGGICVSSAVFEQLPQNNEYDFDDLGYQDLKNIERSVHVYRLRMQLGYGTHPITEVESPVDHQPLFDDDIDAPPLTAGRCACGSVKFEITRKSLGTGFCHCRICQRSSGAPAFPWTAFPADAVVYTRNSLKYYRMSLIGVQGFCEHCGTPVEWRGIKPELSDYRVISTMALDNPQDFAPSWHGCVESQLPWNQIHDDLPRKRAEDSPALCKAWASVGITDPNEWKELEFEKSVELDDFEVG